MSKRNKADSPAQRIALMAMMTALAMVLSYLERLFPPIAGAVPGIKLGLANVVVLFMLYSQGLWQAFLTSMVRVLVMGMAFTSVPAMMYSLAGGLLSLGVMALAKRLGWLSPVGVSVLGGVFHNVGQIALAMWVLQSPVLAAYLPVLLVAGVATGVATGTVAVGVLRAVRVLPPSGAGKPAAPSGAVPEQAEPDTRAQEP